MKGSKSRFLSVAALTGIIILIAAWIIGFICVILGLAYVDTNMEVAKSVTLAWLVVCFVLLSAGVAIQFSRE